MFTPHGSGRVGSVKWCLQSRRSGRVRFNKQEYPGRVGSGQEVFQISRVGTGRDPRDTGRVAGRATLTRKLFSADRRAEPADPS